MKKLAFTLAEVLITLGIIGVVAAMTMPTLITNYQKRATVAKLKRAYSVIKQAYLTSYDQVGDLRSYEIRALGKESYFKTYWAPYIQATYCNSFSECGYASSDKPWKNTNGRPVGTYSSRYIVFYTNDGFLYGINFESGYVMVDINGPKGPNQFGKDVFEFDKISDAKGNNLYLGCYDDSDSRLSSMCSRNNGMCCAEKIRRDGWKITKDYPW